MKSINDSCKVNMRRRRRSRRSRRRRRGGGGEGGEREGGEGEEEEEEKRKETPTDEEDDEPAEDVAPKVLFVDSLATDSVEALLKGEREKKNMIRVLYLTVRQSVSSCVRAFVCERVFAVCESGFAGFFYHFFQDLWMKSIIPA